MVCREHQVVPADIMSLGGFKGQISVVVVCTLYLPTKGQIDGWDNMIVITFFSTATLSRINLQLFYIYCPNGFW
ncbi:hypothetical protein L2E82_35597 [Cichorium intybus]|uniref:Uncharacterized protein n=1 Tax=Cichorium intybus TaxID=13427 RepID=A0ACB9BP91_CICIN|nr:hypothetical protein L2E82_35597 [Cichorium intybus]